MKIAVLADTHIPKRAKDLPPSAYEIIRGVDAIIHAGDVLEHAFLSRLGKFAPVYAVLGNNDYEMDLPVSLELAWEGVKIGLVHDSGNSKGRGKRMRKMFPHADVVIFGHSHIPLDQIEDGILLFNPGSPTDKRRQLKATMGLLHLQSGKVSTEIISL